MESFPGISQSSTKEREKSSRLSASFKNSVFSTHLMHFRMINVDNMVLH